MVAAALLAIGTPKPARAANLTWNQDAFNSGLNWTDKVNWGAAGNAFFPDAEGDTANLNINIGGDQTISLGKIGRAHV